MYDAAEVTLKNIPSVVCVEKDLHTDGRQRHQTIIFDRGVQTYVRVTATMIFDQY